MTILPPPADASRVSCFLADHRHWSAFWDKSMACGESRKTTPTPTSTPNQGDPRVRDTYVGIPHLGWL